MVFTKEFEALARGCDFELLAAWIESVHSSAETARMKANSARETATLLRAETHRMRVESGRAVTRSTPLERRDTSTEQHRILPPLRRTSHGSAVTSWRRQPRPASPCLILDTRDFRSVA